MQRPCCSATVLIYQEDVKSREYSNFYPTRDVNSCPSTHSASVAGFISQTCRQGQLPFSLTATSVNFSDVIPSVLKQLFLHRQKLLLLPSRPELLVQLPPGGAETCGFGTVSECKRPQLPQKSPFYPQSRWGWGQTPPLPAILLPRLATRGGKTTANVGFPVFCPLEKDGIMFLQSRIQSIRP